MRKARQLIDAGGFLYALGEDGSIWRLKVDAMMDKNTFEVSIKHGDDWAEISLPSVLPGPVASSPALVKTTLGDRVTYECWGCGAFASESFGNIQHKGGCENVGRNPFP